MGMDTATRTESVIAAIESGKLGDGYSTREETRTETVTLVHVRRYGRKDCGYVRIDDGEIDLGALKVPGLSDDSILAILSA